MNHKELEKCKTDLLFAITALDHCWGHHQARHCCAGRQPATSSRASALSANHLVLTSQKELYDNAPFHCLRFSISI